MSQTTSKGGAKPQRRGPRKNSRDVILESAIELFSKESIDSVKIRDLERMSGVSAPTIYHFFADKKELHDHAVREAFTRIWSAVYSGLDAAAPPRDYLAQLVTAMLTTFSEQNSVMRIFSNEVNEAAHEALKAELTAKFFDPAYKIWRDALNNVRPGAGEGLLPIFLLAALMGLGQLTVIRQLAASPSPTRPGSPQDSRAIVELILRLAADPAN